MPTPPNLAPAHVSSIPAVDEDCLKLTTYFGERDRVAGGFLADALCAIHERRRLQVSVLMRGVEGFGIKHHRRTDRLLTLSEDLPIVSVAVDATARIEAALSDVEALGAKGLVTLERARMLSGTVDSVEPRRDLGETAKLTLYIGRRAKVGRRPAYLAAVEHLREHGIDGATVLLGVDGTLGGERRRAKFLSGNADVPLMVISVGSAPALAAVGPELSRMLDRPVMTLERVQVLKRDGRQLAQLPAVTAVDESGLGLWQKLMLYAGEQTHANGRPIHVEAIRRLRGSGAAGATALRGIWGYHGDHAPHGDTFSSLRRRVPTLTVVIDTPERIRESFQVLDELTAAAGLITSEIVPALHARGREGAHGGLALARPAKPPAEGAG